MITTPNRIKALRALISFEADLSSIELSLLQYPFDSPVALVTFSRENLKSVLKKFVDKELDAMQIHEWAEIVEIREDIDYDPDNRDVLQTYINELANPILFGQITDSRALTIIDNL